MTNNEDEIRIGNYTTSYQSTNQKIFNRVLKRYVEVGERALFCAHNHLYKTRNRTRKTKDSDYLADVERATKRVLSPEQWSTWCDVALREAGREHAEISQIENARVVELAGAAYIKYQLEPHRYFTYVRWRRVA